MILAGVHPLAISGFFTIALGLIVLQIGYRQAKSKNFTNHRKLMIYAAMINALFLIQYITRYLLGEETQFPGPDIIKYYVYYPILTVHIAGAIVTIVLVAIHLKRSLIEEKRTEDNTIYFRKEYRTAHRKFGRTTFLLWTSSFVGGIIIFFMLYIIF